MSKILIFAGTTEGRLLAEILDSNKIKCDICVATEYGSQMIKPTNYIVVHEGRLDAEAMKNLYIKANCDIVIDATHPYASVVTATIKESIQNTGIKYIRLNRPQTESLEGCDRLYKSAEECVGGLLNTSGRILLTTGSKELGIFANSKLKERLVVRVLPGMESLKLCYDAGLEGKQIIAMQGPFSEAMNQSIYEQYNIEHLVTKESGINGGFFEKVSAAARLGVKVHVIERPDRTAQEAEGITLSEVIKELNDVCGYHIKGTLSEIALIGIGCGNINLLTVEAKEFIANAKYVFGAPRMLEIVKTNAVKYPFYLKEDIIPKLDEIYDIDEAVGIAILFSGDTGFYSGAAKLYDSLKKDLRFRTIIMPGISSISLLSAKIGIDWGTAEILSFHGKKTNQWVGCLKETVRYNASTFIITSGVSDIRTIGQELVGLLDIKVYVGYNLSYNDETVQMLTPEECTRVEKEGLYVCAIVNGKHERKPLIPCIKDEEFIRNKVPMTKETVRHISVCKLNLRQGDTVYDIGSGTGSVAIQIAKVSDSLKVYALECKDEAVDLINSNVEKFSVKNIEVIKTMAPEGLEKLPKADRAFIGGTKGKLKPILDVLYRINPAMRVVINAVSLESITEVYNAINNYNVTNMDITQLNVSMAKKVGDYNLMQANNPVFIFSFDFC